MLLNCSHLIIIKKLEAGQTSILPRLESRTESSIHGRAMDITPNGHAPIRPRAARITLIVPMDSLEEDSLRYANPI